VSEDVFRSAYLNAYFQTGLTNPLDEAIIVYGKPEIAGVVKEVLPSSLFLRICFLGLPRF